MARSAFTVKNSGSIAADNLIVAASDDLHNFKGASISAKSSLTLGSVLTLVNDGAITCNGPIRIMTGRLDNYYGRLASVDDSIYVELYDKGHTKVSGQIETNQALIVKATEASRLKINAKLSPEKSPQLLFVLGSKTGETVVTCPVLLGKQSVARFVVGSSLKLNKDVFFTKCEIGVIGGDQPVSICFNGNTSICQLKIQAATPKTSVSIVGSGILTVEELVLENVGSLSIGINQMEANKVVIWDVTELRLSQGTHVVFQQPPLFNELALLQIDQGAFASVNGSLKMSSGKCDCSGSLALPSGNIVCKELYCRETSRLILGTPQSTDHTEKDNGVESAENKSIEQKSKVTKKKVAMYAASAFFGDPFVQTFLPKLSKLKTTKEEAATKNPAKPSIYIAGAESLQLNGCIISVDSSKNLMLLCDTGRTVIKGLVECAETDVAIITLKLKMSGTINCQGATVQAIDSMKVTRKASFSCHKTCVLKAGKLERKKAPVGAASGDNEKQPEKFSKEEESKLKQFGKNLKEMFTVFPTIMIRGKIHCQNLIVRAKIVVFAVTKDIKVDRFLDINAWVFANLLAAVTSANIQMAVQIIGVNIGALFAWKTFSVTSLCFVNVGFIHGPLLNISGIISLLLVGVTMSFSRFIRAIIKIELLHAALPTLPTKELLTNPIHILNCLLTTLQQILPVPARAAVMIAQAGLMLLGLFKTFFTLAVKIKAMVDKIKKDGIVDLPIQLTDIIGIVVDCVSAWTIFEAGVREMNQGAELSKAYMNELPSATNEFDVDLAKAAVTLIGNYALPTMNETSVFSISDGFRVGYSITDRGIYGHNDGMTVVGGTYMADYVGSYTSHGRILACGDVIVSARYLETTGQVTALGDVRYLADNLVASHILAYGDFRAMVQNNASISNTDANNIMANAVAGSLTIADSKGETIHLQGANVTAQDNAATKTFQASAANNATISHLRACNVDVKANEGSASLTDVTATENISVSAKALAAMFDSQSRNANISGHSVRASGNRASGRFEAFAKSNASVDRVQAGDVIVHSVDGTAKASDITADYLQVQGRANAVLGGAMNVGHAQVQADNVALQTMEDQIFGRLDIRAEHKLENLQEILYRSHEFSKLQITQALNLEVPRQDVILSSILQMNHGLSISANSVSVQANVLASTGNLEFEANNSVSVGQNVSISADTGRTVLHAKGGDVTVGSHASIAGRNGVAVLASQGAVSLQNGSSAGSAVGDVVLHSRGNISFDRANVNAKSGQVLIRSEQGGISANASKISGEEGVALLARNDIGIRANIEAQENGKSYQHTAIQAGKGRPYETMVEMPPSGERRNISRNFGVIVESEDGNIVVQCSDIDAKGDVALNAVKGDVKIEADSYQYVASQDTKTTFLGAKTTTTTTYETHVEDSSIRTDGFLAVNAGNKMESTSASIRANDGFDVRAVNGVQMVDTAKTETTQKTSKWFGGLWEISRQWHDSSNRAFNVVTAADPSADSAVHSGRSVDLRGAQLSSGRSLQVTAFDNVSIQHSSVVSGQQTTIQADGQVSASDSKIASTASDSRTAVRGRHGVDLQTSQVTASGNNESSNGRHLGVIIEASEGDVSMKGSTVTAGGDIAVIAPIGKISVENSSLVTNGFTMMRAINVLVDGQITSYDRREDNWGFYFDVPMASMLSNDYHGARNDLRPAQPLLAPSHNHSSFNMVPSSNSSSADFRSFARPFTAVGRSQFTFGNNPVEQRGNDMTEDHPGSSVGQENNGTRDIQVLDDAFLSSSNAILAVREFVLNGANRREAIQRFDD